MKNPKNNRIFIIGAGFAGRTIAKEIREKELPGEIVAFLDDDREKIGSEYDGIPVFGPIRACEGILRQTQADEAIIAIPSAPRDLLNTIYTLLKKAPFQRIRILPGISQIVSGKAHLIQTRDIDPQDLLGRTPVPIDLKKSLSYVRGKRVLITGAGGSIGSELSRQLLSGGAERIYLFGHGENSIYRIEKELRLLQKEGVGEKATVVPVIGELKDREYMMFILDRLKADIIFHCAAYKHVPMMEQNPIEAVRNNIFGTRNLIDAAVKAEIETLVLISTDKAVKPSCIYGATKFICEEMVLNEQAENQNYMVVRFGNVLGSRGSIVPLFKDQIMNGGPVTVTHPDITRYFMTIPEASSLVLEAGGVGKNGELYLLDMGEPVLIMDLARQMIRFYGYSEDEIPIRLVGLRAGEKMHEQLWAENEEPKKTEKERLIRVKRNDWLGKKLPSLLEELKSVCFYDPDNSLTFRNRKTLRQIIKRYIPTVRIPDDEPEY